MRQREKQMVVDSASLITEGTQCAMVFKMDEQGDITYCPAGDMEKRNYFYSRIMGILAREIESKEEKEVSK